MKDKFSFTRKIFKYLALPVLIYFVGLFMFCCWMFHLHHLHPVTGAVNTLNGAVKSLKLCVNNVIELKADSADIPTQNRALLAPYLAQTAAEFELSSVFIGLLQNGQFTDSLQHSIAGNNNNQALEACKDMLKSIPHNQVIKVKHLKDDTGPYYMSFIYCTSPGGVEYIVGATMYQQGTSTILTKQVVLSSLSGIFFFLLSIPLFAGIIIFMQKHSVELTHVNLELNREIHLRELAKDEAIKAAKCKNVFLANMSHEFKTPLNAIMGFSKILLSNEIGPVNEKQRGVLECIHESGKQLLTMISDILQLSKNETNELKLKLEGVDMASELQNSINLIKNRLDQRHLTISLTVNDCDEKIFIDKVKFHQIFNNLISNAVKYTPDYGSVDIIAMKKIVHDSGSTEHILKLSVKDSGIGISQDNQSRLFHTFEQIDNSLSMDCEGQGLGLMMVKQYVELHGGSIDVESEQEKGSCFTIILPYRRCAC